jgi:hypothetical protein
VTGGVAVQDEPFSAGLEAVMEDTPETLKPLIERQAAYLSIGQHRFITWEPYDERDPAFKLFHVSAYHKPTGRSHPIGVIELQRIPHNRTLFRVPPRSRWDKRFGFDYDSDGKLFLAFLENLFDELTRLGFWSPKEGVEETKNRLGFRLPHEEERTTDEAG